MNHEARRDIDHGNADRRTERVHFVDKLLNLTDMKQVGWADPLLGENRLRKTRFFTKRRQTASSVLVCGTHSLALSPLAFLVNHAPPAVLV